MKKESLGFQHIIWVFVWICLLGISTQVYAQGNKKSKVVIITETVDENGNKKIERIEKDGEEADQMIEQLKINGDNVNIDFEITDIENFDKDIKIFQLGTKEAGIEMQKIIGDDGLIQLKIDIDDIEGLEELENDLQMLKIDDEGRLLSIEIDANDDDEKQIHIKIEDFEDEVEGNIINNIIRHSDCNSDRNNCSSSGSKAFLGINLNLTKNVTVTNGVETVTYSPAVIKSVIHGTAAEKAGLMKGDLIKSIDGKAINSGQELLDILRAAKIGDEIKIKYERNNAQRQTKAVLKARVNYKRSSHHHGNFDNGINKHHYSYSSSSCSKICNKAYLGINIENASKGNGVFVSSVEAGTAADKAGLKKADIIYKLNGESINDTQDLLNEMSELDAGDEVKLRYKRNGKKQNVRLTLGKRPVYNTNSCNNSNSKHFDKNDIIIIDNGENFDSPSITEQANLTNIDEVNGFNLFPNPNDGTFRLRFDIEEEVRTSVVVLDVSGKEMFREELSGIEGDYNRRINLGEKAKGIYILKITQGDKVFTKQIIVN